jgi:hypothetical protein
VTRCSRDPDSVLALGSLPPWLRSPRRLWWRPTPRSSRWTCCSASSCPHTYPARRRWLNASRCAPGSGVKASVVIAALARRDDLALVAAVQQTASPTCRPGSRRWPVPAAMRAGRCTPCGRPTTRTSSTARRRPAVARRWPPDGDGPRPVRSTCPGPSWSRATAERAPARCAARSRPRSSSTSPLRRESMVTPLAGRLDLGPRRGRGRRGVGPAAAPGPLRGAGRQRRAPMSTCSCGPEPSPACPSCRRRGKRRGDGPGQVIGLGTRPATCLVSTPPPRSGVPLLYEGPPR